MINQRVIYFFALIGIILGAMSFVRTGSIIIGVSVVLTALRQERLLLKLMTISIGAALVVVAIVLPHGR